jgi:hypothetical protein
MFSHKSIRSLFLHKNMLSCSHKLPVYEALSLRTDMLQSMFLFSHKKIL